MDARALPANKPLRVKDNEHVSLTVRRVGDTLHLLYEDPETEATVLEGRIGIDDESSELDFYDPDFWTVVVHGEERPDGSLDDLPNAPMSFRVEAADRRLMIELKSFLG
jgi:hypothetical protein